jgi:hypothetical protein
VAISVLQLALIVLVWLLALVPVALMALGATVIQALKPAAPRPPAPILRRLRLPSYREGRSRPEPIDAAAR